MGWYSPTDDPYTGLQDYIAPFITNLGDFQPVAQQFADTFETYNQTYYNDGNALVGKKTFWGYGSQAFLAAVSQQLVNSEPLVRGLRHISAQTATYSQNVSDLASQYDSRLLQIESYTLYPHYGLGSARNMLVASTLQSLDLNTVLKSGSSAVTGPLATAKSSLFSSVESIVHIIFVNTYGQQVDQQAMKAQITAGQDQVSDAASQVGAVLTEWADALQQVTRQYQAIIPTVNDYIAVGDMFQDIYHNNGNGASWSMLQNTNKPISIIPFTMPDGSTRLLVLIAGTDGFHMNYADNIARAIEFGNNPDPNSEYLKDVENAVQSYLKEHPEIKNAQVTLMGYSLGGMVAQEFASEAADYGSNFDSVIAVGSPVMEPPADFSPTSGVDYKLYMGTGDWIPMLSRHEAEFSPLPGNMLDRATSAYFMNWNGKLHQYIDPTGQYGNSIIPVTDLPFHPDSLASELAHGLPNHVMYQNSNFLENQVITQLSGATPDGVPEYFPVTINH